MGMEYSIQSKISVQNVIDFNHKLAKFVNVTSVSAINFSFIDD